MRCARMPGATIADAALVAAGSWTEAASAQAGITLVCAECYLDIRTANWIEDSEAFEALGVEYTRALGTSQDALWRTYGIERLERWDWSLETAQLVFFARRGSESDRRYRIRR